MSMDVNKAVFLDRDGTINKEKNYLYRIEDFEYLDGAVESLRILSDMGYLLIVITNQSGIARGFYSEEDYIMLDSWMKEDLRSKGVRIADSYYCPHLTGGIVADYTKECECRKPKTKLFWRAAQEHDIDMEQSFAIGDKMRDLAICDESAVKGFLLGTRHENVKGNITVCSDWKEIVEKIGAVSSQKAILQ